MDKNWIVLEVDNYDESDRCSVVESNLTEFKARKVADDLNSKMDDYGPYYYMATTVDHHKELISRISF